MKIESITKNVVFICVALIFTQTNVAEASSLEDTIEEYSQLIKEVTDETYEEKVYNPGKVTLVLFNMEQTKRKKFEKLRKSALITINRVVEEYNKEINFLLYTIKKENIETPKKTDKEQKRLLDKYAVYVVPALALYKKDGTIMEILPGGTLKKVREKDIQWYIDFLNPSNFDSYKSLPVEEYKAGVRKRLGVK